MALAPWPESADERDRAAKVIADAVEGAAANRDRALALGAAAAAMVQQYAPGAPAALKDEAVLRFAGYLAQSDFGSIAKEDIGGARVVEYPTNHAAAFRSSGAAMLLSRWRVRRAGKIG